MLKAIQDIAWGVAGPACVLLFLAMIGLAVRFTFWIFP